MKHNKLGRIWLSVLINAILVLVVWDTFQSYIWHVTNSTGDVWVKIFAALGMLAALLGVNYLIEVSTRVKNNGD
jgi:hypothetical protein